MKRQELIEKWLEALESGEYKQGTGELTDEKMKRWCCLGVVCDVARKNGVRKLSDEELINNGYLPATMSKALGIDEEGGFLENIRYRGRIFDTLARLNDAGVRFKTIAKIIRQNLAAGNFKKP